MCDEESPRDTLKECGLDAVLAYRDLRASLASALTAHVKWAKAAETFAGSCAAQDELEDATKEAATAKTRVEMFTEITRQLKSAE